MFHFGTCGENVPFDVISIDNGNQVVISNNSFLFPVKNWILRESPSTEIKLLGDFTEKLQTAGIHLKIMLLQFRGIEVALF